MVRIDKLPGFPGIVRNIHAAILVGFHRCVDPARLARGDGNADAAQTVFGARQSSCQRAPVRSSVRGLKDSTACRNERRAAANFPRRDASSPEHGIDCLRARGVELQVGRAGVFVLIQNLLESLAAIGRTKNAALGVRAVRMPHGSDKKAVRIFRVNNNCSNLLRVAQSEVHPRFPRIGRFVNSVARGQVRPLQTFSAANVNHIRIRRSHSKRTH